LTNDRKDHTVFYREETRSAPEIAARAADMKNGLLSAHLVSVVSAAFFAKNPDREGPAGRGRDIWASKRKDQMRDEAF
jgi:hypothetical protein